MCPCGGIVEDVPGTRFWQCPYCGTLYPFPPDDAPEADQ